jgi:tetratricopeptide (TPR) repeat protein
VAIHELGSLHLDRGEIQKAARAYRQALRLCRWSWPVHHDEAAANRVALATIALKTYRWNDILRLASRALREAWSAHDFRHIIAAERLIATALDELGKYEEVESRLQAALELCDRFGAEMKKAQVLATWGWFDYGQAIINETPLTEATGRFREALETAQHVHDLFSGLDARLGLGWCALRHGATEEATRWCEEISSMLPLGRYAELSVGARLGLAGVAHQQEDLEQAESQYQEVIALSEKTQGTKMAL